MEKKLKHACCVCFSLLWSQSLCWLEFELALTGLPTISLWFLSLGLNVNKQMSSLFWERLNWTCQHFRQIVESLREKAYSRYSEDLRHWEYLFNGLVLCAVEYSVLGIKSWLCHINPKEEAAFSCMAPGAEEASCHSSVTMWSLYSLHPSVEGSQR